METTSQQLAKGLHTQLMVEAYLYAQDKQLAPEPIRLQQAFIEIGPTMLEKLTALACGVSDDKVSPEQGFRIFLNTMRAFARNAVDRAVKVSDPQ